MDQQLDNRLLNNIKLAKDLEIILKTSSKGTMDFKKIADILLDYSNAKIIQNTIYTYDYSTGVYKQHTNKEKTQTILLIFRSLISNIKNSESDGLFTIRMQRETLQYFMTNEKYIRQEADLNPPHFVNHTNGLVYFDIIIQPDNTRVVNINLISHTPEIITTHQIPFDYNVQYTKSDHPIFSKDLKYLCSTIHDGEFKPDTKKEDIILCALAMGLFGNVPKLHKYFIIYGSGSNGKSNITELLKYLTTKNLPLNGKDMHIKPFKLRDIVGSALERDQWALSDLIDAKCIIDDDIGFIKYPKMTNFNSLITGAEQKINQRYRDSYTRQFKGTAILLTTEMPKMKVEGADIRRVQPIKFQRKFDDKHEKPILNYYMKWSNEAEAIISTLYQYMKTILQHGELPVQYTSDEVADTLQETIDDPLHEIVQDLFEEDLIGAMTYDEIQTHISNMFDEKYPFEAEQLKQKYVHKTAIGKVPLIQHMKYKRRVPHKTSPQIFYRLKLREYDK